MEELLLPRIQFNYAFDKICYEIKASDAEVCESPAHCGGDLGALLREILNPLGIKTKNDKRIEER